MSMFTTNPTSLKQLLGDVADGKIQLPDFQRNWVWDDERIKGLLSSISRGFPVGAVMTLVAGDKIRFKPRLIEGVDPGNPTDPESFILDGQQRLTSLYQALMHRGPVDTRDNRGKRVRRRYYIDMMKAMDLQVDREEAFISVPEDRVIRRAFGREVDLDLSSAELEYEHHMMPAERLIDSMSWMLAYNSFWGGRDDYPRNDLPRFIEAFNKLILNTFNEYSLPVISLGKSTPKEAVCKIFEKVNTGGVTLNVFELVTAAFAADDFDLRGDWDERRRKMREGRAVLRGIEGEHFLQVVALLATFKRRKAFLKNDTLSTQAPGVSCKKEAILDLTAEDYREWADAVEEGFEEAAKFLQSQFVFTHRDMPYSTQLVPLAALNVELDDELQPARAQALLERWYWSGIFGESYGSNVETQYALDLQQVSEYVRREGEPVPTLITEASFTPERLLTMRTRNSAAYKGLYALQMKCGAADWRTGQPLSIATWEESIDIHHIFPKAWFNTFRRDVPSALRDSIINKTPIDSRTNRIIGHRSPSSYLRRLERDIDRDALDKILDAHWLNPESLREDEFEEMFVERGEKMLQLIYGAMGKTMIPEGRRAFREALGADGVEDELDDSETEYDPVGTRDYEQAAGDDRVS